MSKLTYWLLFAAGLIPLIVGLVGLTYAAAHIGGYPAVAGCWIISMAAGYAYATVFTRLFGVWIDGRRCDKNGREID